MSLFSWRNPATSFDPNRLSQQVKDGLTSIYKLFQSVSLDVAQHLNNEDQTNLNPKRYVLAPGADIPRLDDLIDGLKDTSCLEFWNTAATRLLEAQGSSQSWPEVAWQITKEHARTILEYREETVEIFATIRDELDRSHQRELSNSIVKKLRALERYSAVYGRQPAPTTMDHKPAVEPYFLFTGVERTGRNRAVAYAHAYPQTQQRFNAKFIAIVFLVTMVAMLLFILAWRAPSSAGTTADADFWLLVQNSTMQLLGLFTSLYPIYKTSNGSAWRWALVFTCLGCVCSLGAIPMYLYIPTIWSSLIAFFGSAAQICMALELALMAIPGSTGLPSKED